jgi:hypothetical protein
MLPPDQLPEMPFLDNFRLADNSGVDDEKPVSQYLSRSSSAKLSQ